ncbi:MAG: hypothetical protein J6W10_02960 [Kiritimatiellae bacterium]|nr:hypothetical protein [Kiritimatiellia bacterium]
MKKIIALFSILSVAAAFGECVVSMGLLAPTGRKVETFSWSSSRGGERHNMILVHPKDKTQDSKAPLFVALHGHGASIIGNYRWESMPIDDAGKCDICWIPEDFYGLILEVRRIEDWWGIPKDCVVPKVKGGERAPVPDEISETEKRVLEQVEWAASNLPVDRNRIYLGGASMGGSGTLGLGLVNGDVFAAIKANVSASPYHALKRLGLGGELARIPDPPVLVEYSAQNDRWSLDKDLLYSGMDAAKYSIFAYWGPFGHTGRNSKVLPKNDLVGSFNIFDIKLNEPYVAFSSASSNDPMPWPDGYLKNKKHPLGNSSGQRNAYFRWKNVKDSSDSFEVDLRLITENDWKSTRFKFPKAAKADVTPRRVVNFSINAGERIAWEYGGEKGEVVADKTGHMTIPQLEIATSPCRLTLKRIMPRTGKSVSKTARVSRQPGEAKKGIMLGEYQGEFISVDGVHKPGEVAEIMVLREPFKSGDSRNKEFAPLKVVHCSDAYKTAFNGGEENAPEGSWALFIGGGEKAKTNDYVKCAIDFVKKLHPRTELLTKAEEAKPELYNRTLKPRRIVNAVADKTAFQGWKVDSAAEVESAFSRPLSRGEEFIFDFGEHLVGYLTVSLDGFERPVDAPVRLEFNFAEVPSELELSRDECEKVGTISPSWVQDEVVNFDFVPGVYELPRRYAFRYVRIRVKQCSKGGKFCLKGISARAVSSGDFAKYTPIDGASEIDKAIDRVSAATLRDSMQTCLEDGPKRDRRLWLGDLRLQALADYATFRDFDVVKRSLYLVAGCAFEDGSPATAVYEKPQTRNANGRQILDYTALFPLMVLEYYKETGDRETVEDLWPTAIAACRKVLTAVDDTGLVKEDNGFWNFIDWQDGFNRQASEQGAIIYGLDSMCGLAKALSKEDEVKDLPAMIEKMRRRAVEVLWDDERGVWASGKERNVSWMSQAYLALAKAGSEKMRREALARVRSLEGAVRPRTPYAYHYFVEGLWSADMKSEAMKLVREYWGGMVAKGADTFWEAYDPNDDFVSPYRSVLLNSYCHAWSCTPSYWLRKANKEDLK